MPSIRPHAASTASGRKCSNHKDPSARRISTTRKCNIPLSKNSGVLAYISRGGVGLEPKGYGAVIGEGYPHVGAEATSLNASVLRLGAFDQVIEQPRALGRRCGRCEAGA